MLSSVTFSIYLPRNTLVCIDVDLISECFCLHSKHELHSALSRHKVGWETTICCSPPLVLSVLNAKVGYNGWIVVGTVDVEG